MLDLAYDLEMVTRIPTGESAFLLKGIIFCICKENNEMCKNC